MGSFANSLHIRADRTETVVAAVHDILREQDWQPTDELPEADELLVYLPDGKRVIHISAPANGWVSLLDSDLACVLDLGGALAEKLGTPTIFFLVNDSDGWSYRLVQASGKISEFDTQEQDSREESAGPNENYSLEQVNEIINPFVAGAPPEIQQIATRIKASTVTTDEFQQYAAWLMQEMPKFQSQIIDLVGGVPRASAAPGSPKKTTAKLNRKQKAAQRKRLETLRPLLAAGVSDEQLQAALDKRTLFAEQALAEFLPLVSISPHYAYLDYRSLSETTAEELAAANIRFTHHLKFENN